MSVSKESLSCRPITSHDEELSAPLLQQPNLDVSLSVKRHSSSSSPSRTPRGKDGSSSSSSSWLRWVAIMLILAAFPLSKLLVIMTIDSTGSPLELRLPGSGLFSMQRATAADTLVIYIYSDTDPEYAANMQYFIDNAVKLGDRCDYVFVVQVRSCLVGQCGRDQAGLGPQAQAHWTGLRGCSQRHLRSGGGRAVAQRRHS